MPENGSGSVQLLNVDPDLGRALDSRRAREAAHRLYARAIDIPRGRWSRTRRCWRARADRPAAPRGPARARDDGRRPPLGRAARPWRRDPRLGRPGPRGAAAAHGRVERADPTRVAIIDHAFAVRAAQWPEVFASLLDRAARRAERLVVMQAIAHLTRVDDRLLALLWCLAERWGRVVPDGVLVSLRLSHRTLAGMVGARRPSVTTALGQLMARGRARAARRRGVDPLRRRAGGPRFRAARRGAVRARLIPAVRLRTPICGD